MARTNPIFVALLVAAITGVSAFGMDSPAPWIFLALVVVYGITVGPLPAITPWGMLNQFGWMRDWIPPRVRWAIKLTILMVAVGTMLLLIGCNHGGIDLNGTNLLWISISVGFGMLWPKATHVTVTGASEFLAAFYPPPPISEGCLQLATSSQAYVPAYSSDSPYRPPRFTSRAIPWRARMISR